MHRIDISLVAGLDDADDFCLLQVRFPEVARHQRMPLRCHIQLSEGTMRLLHLMLAASILLMCSSGQLFAQSLRIGPGGVEIRPAEPPPLPPRPRDELRERKLGPRIACDDGDRRACVRLGIIIGEHRERREEWRREHPDVFFYER